MRSAFAATPWFGGDYNPEQWPREVWDEDVSLMQQAGVTLATVGVFSWALLEPEEGVYDFAWLDTVLDTLHAGGIRVDLATATASPPMWFSHRYPDSLPVTADGVRLHAGSRQAYCPSSPVYREAAVRLVTALAERYGDHPALVLWHVNNEYGCHVSRCYCEESGNAFRRWLIRRYGTVDALNEAWGTTFWSQRYTSFDQIEPPRTTPAYGNPSQLLDFDRFSSDELLDCFLAEKEVLRRVTPEIPVTTNFMGLFRGLDYWRWAPHVDVVADDLYPDPADPDSARSAALARDLMRSLGHGRPWLLMEQAAGAANMRPSNAPKAPGQMRALSYQAIARGADGILFFQWRQSAVGAEQFHSAMLPHAGTDTRIWREIEALGSELGSLDAVTGAPVRARAAIVLDWESWWAIEHRGLAMRSSYPSLIAPWHAALSEEGVVVDFVRGDEDLSGYALIVAPAMFVADDARLAALDAAVRGGSVLLVTPQSAIVDTTHRARLGGYLGSLQQTLGVWIEEFVPLAGAWDRPGAIPVRPESTVAPSVRVEGPVFADGAAIGVEWSEAVRVHDADVQAVFADGPLSGRPALTRRVSGDGTAWYLATRLGLDDTRALIRTLVAEAGIAPLRVHDEPTPSWVEAVRRGDLTVVINHGATPMTLTLSGIDLLSGASAAGLRLGSQGVAVVRGA